MKIEWKGGECPVSGDTEVRVWLRNGARTNGESGDFMWTHHGYGFGGDIIAYEVIEEAKEELEAIIEKTLRDEFAMAAITGILSRQSSNGSADEIATMAYLMADEMIIARVE